MDRIVLPGKILSKSFRDGGEIDRIQARRDFRYGGQTARKFHQREPAGILRPLAIGPKRGDQDAGHPSSSPPENDPNGTRTRVAGVKGRCPGPG